MKIGWVYKSLCGMVTAALIGGCGPSKAPVGTDKTNIVMGVSPGPYSELFTKAIEPELVKQGFKIDHINFSDLLGADIAVNEQAVDFNVDQHTAYLNTFNKQRSADLKPLVRIPTVTTALFSTRHSSLEEVSAHAKVAIPLDPSNAARAYRLLEKAGWITLQPDADPVLLTRNNIVRNVKEIEIIEMDSANIPRTMSDVDYAVIPGAVAYPAKIDQSTSLLREDLIDSLYLVVAVKAGNENTNWARAIRDAYQSEAFRDYLQAHNSDGMWHIPPVQ